MEILQNISAGFWSPDIWLPPNTTWADLTPTADNNFLDYRHLIFPIIMSIGMLGLRYVLERFWFAPFGKSLGIKNTRPKKASPNVILEKAYTGKKIKHKQVLALAKQLDWSERQVERWLRLRRSQDKPSTLTKFCENSWRCLYYTYSFTFGLTILWDKPWLWEIKNCYYNYPFHPVTSDVWWYYMVSMAFYWSLSFSQFFDVKRKDFWQMFIHHIATIILMCFSWIGNLTRIGSLVLLVHDCADIFLEAAKMAKYANYQKLCDFIFVIFTILWIVTRMGVYPFWIIYSTTIEAPKIVPMFPAYFIFNALLSLLLVLHAIWTWLILKIAYNAFYAGQMEGDIRSSSSEDISDSLMNSSTTNNSNEPQKVKVNQREKQH
ncbi:ceramide synthase 6 [Neodiprion pinetum]|uniref:Ceramide synthase 6 n=1 Tax=Neodiprion lecontei TaxID=441921 RepID=A0A6J0C0A1_NEOLC|nr:ceramide synthase 6 [Neodiprion lecontei]XP_046421744.1 ceramide synthase 6 [Neodiprion fabricii]XP_046480321.1 ceramide synthase 6 [Neodiprion pinetum]XP_046617718.1 ceramide synthase 6 [Neodiprion virginianus]